MSNSNQNYRHTGKNLSVSREDLVQAVREKLAEYDSLNNNQRAKYPNPYVSPVYAKTSDNKTVQVPRYLQNAVIVKWKTTKGSSHTRLDNSKRSSFRDPYVMNCDINGVRGSPDDLEDADDGLTQRDHEINQRDTENNRRNVGLVVVPDQRFGKGGSAGDLSGDFDRFDTEIHSKMKHDQHTNGYEPEFDDDASLLMEPRQVRRPNIKSCDNSLKTNNVPADDIVSGVNPDDDMGAGSSEQFASVEIDDNNYNEYNDEETEHATEHKMSNIGDDRVIYRRPQRPSDNYDYDDRYEADAYDVDMSDQNEEVIEGMDARAYCEPEYKYLFFILLIIMLFMGYTYKKNKGTGLF
jgi:hypothetical protein